MDERDACRPVRKVLVVVYDFPPEIGGGGVMRTVKVAKYLRETDWQPVVLTVSRRDTLMPDPALLEEIGETAVYRAPDWISRLNPGAGGGSGAGGEGGWLSAVKALVKELLVPDRRAGWLLPALLLGRRVMKREGVDLIYATAPPQTPLLVGWLLSLATGKPLVVDYRDAWSGNTLFRGRWGWKNALNGWLERRVLGRAALAVATTPALLASLRAFTPRATLIGNGFDPADFAGLAPRPLPEGKVNLVYLGGFDGFRTANYLARAIAGLDGPDKERLALHVVGPVSAAERALLESAGGMEVNLVGTLPHREALEYLLSADALLIVIHPEEDSDRAIPGKVYEYLAAGKPILALCEEKSALGFLLSELGNGTVVPPRDVAAIAAALSRLTAGALPAGLASDFSRFDRRANAHRLARAFDEVCKPREH